jgi:hypothetical protein
MICMQKNFRAGCRALLTAVLGIVTWLLSPAVSLAQTQSVTFGWEADSDPSIAGYNIYYGTASQDYTNKLSFGDVTTATVSNLVPGVTYYFAADTYDASNQESALSPEIVYTVPGVVTQPGPSISSISVTNAIDSGQNLSFLVSATGTGPLTYSLAPGAPSGASINPTNGLFHWTPGTYQGSTTYVISVIVTDTSTSLSSTQSFTVVTADNVSVLLGATVAATNSIGSLPLSIYASAPVTNLQFTLTYPSDQLANPSFTPENASVGTASVTPLSPGQAQVNVPILPGQTLTGLQSLGAINFATRNTSKTSIAYVQTSPTGVLKTDGTTVGQEFGSLGRVTIVGQDSMLEGFSTNGVRNLVLYGPVGAGYIVQSSAGLSTVGNWSDTAYAVTMNGLSQVVQIPLDGSSAIFYRTRRTQ